MEYVFQDTESLQTPVGAFVVTDGEKRIRFSVRKNECIPRTYQSPDTGEMREIRTDTLYSIIIDTGILEIGKTYKIMFTAGSWKFCDGDEHTDCYFSIINDWAVGIGGYDPNDDEKLRQAFAYTKQIGLPDEKKEIIAPERYDETKFVGYQIEVLDNCNGYAFTLLDRTWDKILFDVAWIQITKYSPDECEDALAIWLC